MSTNGVYGTNIPATIDASDIEIYYTYRANQTVTDTDSLVYKKLDSNILKPSQRIGSTDDADTVLEGMYDLELPLSVFNRKGFYNVYIKPKEIRCVISDIGTLAAYNDVRGIVVDTSKISSENKDKFSENNGLVGYRVVYLNPNTGGRENYYRLVTSNNRCEPMTQSVTNSNDKIVVYRYNDSSTLTFITVTPSVSSTFNANAIPFIGNVAQEVLFVNTKFEPLLIEIEMVDHDADTISNMLEGSQVRDLENGLVTTFNDNNEIYHQSQHYTLKDEYTGEPVYEVKKNQKNDIDFGQTIADK
jgi:hypothetical protein